MYMFYRLYMIYIVYIIVDGFLERHKLLKLTQKEIENPYRPITIKETELIKHFTRVRAQDQMVSLVQSTKHLKN